MTVLVDWQLRDLIDGRQLKVLPLMDGAIQPNSIDVRLGNNFATYVGKAPIDPYDKESVLQDLMTIQNHEVTISRGAFLLAETLETLELPSNICATIEGKSSLARLGLTVHQTGGWIDCLPHDTLVETYSGLVPICNLEPGYKLSTNNYVVAHKATGPKEIVDIQTRLNWGFKSSNAHKFLVKNISSMESVGSKRLEALPEIWKRAEDLTDMDVLVLPFRNYLDNIGIDTTLSECYRAGAMYGDGTLTGSNNHIFRFYNTDKEILARLGNKVYTNSISKCFWTLVKKSSLGNALDAIQEAPMVKQLQPRVLSLMSVQQFAAFVAGWFDADGGITNIGNKDQFEIRITDCRYQEWYGILFKGFGVITTHSVFDDRVNTHSPKHDFRLSVCDPRFWDTFSKLSLKISRYNGRIIKPLRKRATTKIDHFRYTYSKDMNTLYLRVKGLYDDTPTECYDIATTEHSYSIGCIVHNCGFRGTITLEMTCENDRPIILRTGMPIAQIVFFQTEPAKVPYSEKHTAKYAGQKGATASRFYLNNKIEI